MGQHHEASFGAPSSLVVLPVNKTTTVHLSNFLADPFGRIFLDAEIVPFIIYDRDARRKQ